MAKMTGSSKIEDEDGHPYRMCHIFKCMETATNEVIDSVGTEGAVCDRHFEELFDKPGSGKPLLMEPKYEQKDQQKDEGLAFIEGFLRGLAINSTFDEAREIRNIADKISQVREYNRNIIKGG